MAQLLNKFLDDECGATAIEYAMIAMIVGLGIIGSLQGLPEGFNGIMNNASAGLSTASE